VNSGHYDWVLAEITQGSQYQTQADEPKGFAQQRQRDPALSTEVLEDRASLLFWKWIEAQSGGDAARLAKVASPAFVDRIKAEIAQLAEQGKRKCFIECAVGAVDTLQFVQAGERTIAAVEIRWSARMAIAAPEGQPPSVPSQPQRHVMLLERRAGAQTGSAGMATNRCPSCAAPLSDNGQPTCDSCCSVLSGGEADWVLRDFGSWEWWRAQGQKPAASALSGQEVPDREERERLVYLMVAMAKADGVIDQKESAMLRMAAGRWEVPWANVEQAMNAADEALPAVEKGSAEAESMLRDVVQLMRADGKIDAKEKKLLKQLAIHLGFQERFGEFVK
jgi:tellurite resistance protein